MIGSNRSGGTRNLRDRSKASILNKPVDTVRVKRRVKDDQVSSYSLRVHRGSSPTQQPEHTAVLYNRDADPGEGELLLLQPEYRNFVRRMTDAHVGHTIDGLHRRQNERFVPDLLAAMIGHAVYQEHTDRLQQILESAPRSQLRMAIGRLGRATWRYAVRSPDMRGSLYRIDKRLPNMIGEIALNANTIYRQGADVLRYMIPAIDDIISDIDYIDVGDQQMFNTKSINLLPSSVFPSKSHGYSSVSIAGGNNTWLFSEPGKSHFRDKVISTLDAGPHSTIKVSVLGHLNKRGVTTMRVSDRGLFTKKKAIEWASVNRVLSGFRLSNGDKSIIVPPIIGHHLLNEQERADRTELFRTYVKNGDDLLRQMRERGVAGFGDDEIDLYNDRQYKWSAGRRSIAGEDDIISSIFPHPLVRLAAIQYRDAETTELVKSKLGSAIACTLPLMPSTPR